MVAHIVTTGLQGHEIKVFLIARPEHELGTILVEHRGSRNSTALKKSGVVSSCSSRPWFST
jgi:hypothetical protein